VAKEFRLPDIGEGLTEAEIVRWLVAVGERVEADQPVVEVETDKAVVEIPSPYAGIVLQHGGAEGETIAVGSVLVVITEPGESSAPADILAPTEQPPVVSAAPIVGTLSEDAEDLSVPSVETEETAETEQVKALPIVRKMARDMGVDLSEIAGSGPEGRITREDVAAAAGPVAAETEPIPEPVSSPRSEGSLGEVAPKATEGFVAPPSERSEPVSPPSERSERWGEYRQRREGG
jgi:pyruvate dehydrogenase E2 component (dihydrolipoamide acetyltransferase)